MWKFSLFKKKQVVVFVFAPRYEHSGSTIMRGQQLSQLFRTYYKSLYKVTYRPLSTSFKDSVIILTKGAVTDITTDQIAFLRTRGNRVILDFVDNPLNMDKARAASAVIAASYEAQQNYISLGLNSFLVNHHVDTRLPRQAKNQAQGFNCGYFGELVNTIKTDAISQYVSFVQVDTGKQTHEWLSRPLQYSLHYCIRSYNVEAYKPFLKGFTAAASGANLIIQRDQKEALHWLGEDYPYLLNPNPTESEIISMLQYAQSTFGTDVWNKGLEKMKLIKEATSDEAITTELHRAIQSL